MILHLHRAGNSHLLAAEEPRHELPRDLQVDAHGRRRSHPCRHRGRQARRRSADDQGLLRHAARDAHAAEPRARPVLRAGLGVARTRSCRSPRAASTPARCISCSTISAKTWCCSSAAARSATRWASRPARRRTASRSKRWSWRATKAATICERRPADPRARRQVVHAAQGRARYLEGHQLQLRIDRHRRLRAHRHRQRLIRRNRAMMTNTGTSVTQGQFSFLPDLTDEQITRADQVRARTTAGRSASSTPTIRTRATPTGRCSATRCSTSRIRPASSWRSTTAARLPEPLRPRHRVRLDARRRSRRRCRSSSTGPKTEPGFGLYARRSTAAASATRFTRYATDKPRRRALLTDRPLPSTRRCVDATPAQPTA